MATELEIANIVLNHLGEMDVDSTEYTAGTKTKALKLIKARFPNMKRAFLRLHPFNRSVDRCYITPLYKTIEIEVENPTGTFVTETLTYSGATDYTVQNNDWVGSTFGLRRTSALTWTFGNAAFSATYNTCSNFKNFATQTPWLFEEAQWATDWDASSFPKLTKIDWKVLDDTALPNHEYSYKSLLPIRTTDSITSSIRLLQTPGLDDRDFRIEGENFYSNSNKVDAIYIDAIDYPDFDDLMVEAFALYAAKSLTWIINQDKELVQMLQQMYRQTMSKCRTIDSQEDGTYTLNSDAWVSSRTGGYDRADRFYQYQPS